MYNLIFHVVTFYKEWNKYDNVKLSSEKEKKCTTLSSTVSGFVEAGRIVTTLPFPDWNWFLFQNQS